MRAGDPPQIRYPASTATWDEWQLEYRYGALYVFPPAGVIEEVDELRRRHDPQSHAICAAHISVSEPLPGPLTVAQARELTDAVRRLDPFVIRYGPLRSFPPHPGVAFEIHPHRHVLAVRDAVHATSPFADVEGRRSGIAAHMTIAEFVSVEETDELLGRLKNVSGGEFRCDALEYAVPDEGFRFSRQRVFPFRILPV